MAATNLIKLFGEDLKTSYVDATKGYCFTDTAWNTHTTGNSTVRETGFKGNTGISSIALNTALRQASIGSKIIGDILASSDLGIFDSGTIGSDPDQVESYVTGLTTYLNQIQQLLSGGLVANIAVYMDANATADGTINGEYQKINNKITTLSTNLTTGASPVKRATYYYDGTANVDINSTLSSLVQQVSTAVTETSTTLTFSNSVDGVNGDWANDSSHDNNNIYRKGNLVYTKKEALWFTLSNEVDFSSYGRASGTNFHDGSYFQLGQITASAYKPTSTYYCYCTLKLHYHWQTSVTTSSTSITAYTLGELKIDTDGKIYVAGFSNYYPPSSGYKTDIKLQAVIFNPHYTIS